MLAIAVFVMVAVSCGSTHVEPKPSINRSGYQRSDGLVLNDWCIKGEPNMQCEMVNGAECVDDSSMAPFFAHACKCTNNFEQYTTFSGGVARCRMKSTAVSRLTDVSCQIPEDCYQFYPTAICNAGVNGRPGKCGCPVDYVVDSSNPKVCKLFECTSDTECQNNFSPDSVCNKGSPRATCICRANFYLGVPSANVNNGKPVCTDLKQYVCDNTNKFCPAIAGLSCDSVTSRCACQSGFALAAILPNTAECRAYTPQIGGPCIVDSECPANAECLSFSSLGRKICMCKPYFRTSEVDKKSCQSILGKCCRSDTDCSVAKLPALSGGITGGLLRCVKSPFTAEKGNCGCENGKFWDWNSLTSANVVTPSCTSTPCA